MLHTASVAAIATVCGSRLLLVLPAEPEQYLAGDFFYHPFNVYLRAPDHSF
jgi:hypothetical protein